MDENERITDNVENNDGDLKKTKVPLLLRWWVVLIVLCSGVASFLAVVLAIARLVYNHKHPEHKLTKKQKKTCLCVAGVTLVLLIWLGSDESIDSDSENDTYTSQDEEQIQENVAESETEQLEYEEEGEGTIKVVEEQKEDTDSGVDEDNPLSEFYEMTEEEMQEFYTQYADNPSLAVMIFPLKHYAKLHDIELETFKKEQKKLSKWMSGLKDEDVFYPAAIDPALFDGTDGDRYEVLETSYSEDYSYKGETKKNRPDGYGILKGEGKMYVGEFKDGYMDGYGILFSAPLTYDEAELFYMLELGCIFGRTDNRWLPQYEGEFSKGEFSGKGNWFYLKCNPYSEEAPFSTLITTGDFKSNTGNGDIKDYANGYLLYSGEVKSGDYHGKGTLYYMNSEQVVYEGEFKNGIYHGKGTLYNEDGSVFHKGKWENGDPYK